MLIELQFFYIISEFIGVWIHLLFHLLIKLVRIGLSLFDELISIKMINN
jgi:hypothetical protein